MYGLGVSGQRFQVGGGEVGKEGVHLLRVLPSLPVNKLGLL